MYMYMHKLHTHVHTKCICMCVCMYVCICVYTHLCINIKEVNYMVIEKMAITIKRLSNNPKRVSRI